VTALAAAEEALKETTDAEGNALADAGRLDAAFEEARHAYEETERLRRERADAFAVAREALLSAEAAVAAAAREGEEAAARRQLLEAQRGEAQADHLRAVEEAGRSETAREAVDAELAVAEERLAAAAAALEDVSAREAELLARREGSRRDLLAAGARAADAGNRERDAALLSERLSFALTKLEERVARATEALASREAAAAEAASSN
jgi:hypothetical protein